MKIILSLWMLCVVAVCAIAMPEQLRNVKPDSLKELEDEMLGYWKAWSLASNPDRTPEDELRAAKIFALMIEGGLDPEIAPSPSGNAAYKLATLFETGKTVRNDREALKLYKQLAGTGHPEAIYRLGCLYDIGKIVDQNDFIASTYYSMHIGPINSGAGGSRGTIRLANMSYLDSIRWTDSFGYARTLKMYQSVFSEGKTEELENQIIPYHIDIAHLEETYSLWVLAACRIAHMYGRGLGAERNYFLTREWYQRADKMDMIRYFIRSHGVPDNQQKGASCFDEADWLYFSMGSTPIENMSEHLASIMELFNCAVEQGYEHGILLLGWYFDEGYIGPRNGIEAAKYYRMLENNPLALYRLAVIHLEGRDRIAGGGSQPRNNKKAFELLKRSVELSEENFKAGNPTVALPAFYRLAEMYLNGTGGEKNPEEADRLIKLTEDVPHDRNIPAEIPSKYY